jgi:hypothetical protein
MDMNNPVPSMDADKSRTAATAILCDAVLSFPVSDIRIFLPSIGTT